ncbi:MAG: hypothetical protein RLZZ448_786 [Actinomycetota bacterium]
MIIADAPGHEQYTRNMAVAASRADIALVLVDATRGVRVQTLRHLTICALMGVEKVIVVINKLDASSFDQRIYDNLVQELTPAIKRLAIEDVQELTPAIKRLAIEDACFIPVSALEGDNVVYKTPKTVWYAGGSLLEEIQNWREKPRKNEHKRMGVQLIFRHGEPRRI